MNIFQKIIYRIIALITFCEILLCVYVLKIHIITPKIDDTSFLKQNSYVILDGTSKNVLDGAFFYRDISYYELSPNIINALISTEDKSFFSHNGINPIRIIKSSLNDIKALRFKEGASTITQQVIKNKYLTNDKKINRKIKEIIMSLKLEKILTKEQIIEYYLNNVLFGDNIFGIYNASLYYFNKYPQDITIDEAATLIGLIQLPNYYNPYKNIDLATNRRNQVLHLMKNANYLSLDEYKLYKQIDLEKKLKKNEMFNKTSYYNHYLDYLYSKNIKEPYIKTFMDPQISKKLYDISNDKYKIINDDQIDISMLVLDNKTGNILGISANRSYDRKVTNGILVKRQMASTLKPIIDYALAFENYNLSPASIINDEPYYYDNNMRLNNWDNLYKGKITLRQALKESRNVPALKLFKMVDNETRKKFMNQLDLQFNDAYESDAIGCGKNLYSLLEIANCYQAFANEGVFIKARCAEQEKTSSKRVMSKETAFFINSILHDVFKGSSFDIKDGYLMAKTGQTNYDEKTRKKYNIPPHQTKDSYLIGYTPNITLAISCCYKRIDNDHYLDRIKTQIPRKIMKEFMKEFGKSDSISIPNTVKGYNYEIKDDKLYLGGNSFDYFKIGYEPKTFYKKKDYYLI